MHHHNRGGKNHLKGRGGKFSKSVARTKPHRVRQLPKRGNRAGGRG